MTLAGPTVLRVERGVGVLFCAELLLLLLLGGVGAWRMDDGIAARIELRGLLLGIDGLALRRRRNEPGLGGSACDHRGDREDGPRR